MPGSKRKVIIMFWGVLFVLYCIKLFMGISSWRSLKERYRIGKKQKSWRSHFYIQLRRSSDDDSRKHPLKYLCLKCHNLMRNKYYNFAFGVYRSMSVLFIFCFGIDAMHKSVICWSLFSCDPDGRLISCLYRFVILCIWWIT